MSQEPKKHLSPWIAWSIVLLVAGSAGFAVWFYWNQIDTICCNINVTTSKKTDNTDKTKVSTSGKNIVEITCVKDPTEKFCIKDEISNNKVKVGEIALANNGAINAQILKQTDNNAYIVAQPDGLGGYINYTEDEQDVYRLVFATNKLEKISSYRGDISPDEKYLASVKREDSAVKSVILININTQEIQEFDIPIGYGQAGDVKFSPDGKKIAFAASVGDPSNESGNVYILDIASGMISKVNTEDITGQVPHVSGWKDNTTVNWNKS